ncbi:MAG: phosphoadenylyl-sulfate reductase [Gaiellales bacterium]
MLRTSQRAPTEQTSFPITPAEAEALPASSLVAAALEAFHPRISVACSFQQEEAVLLDMVFSVRPDARVFALDTDVLFPETYATWQAIESRYGVQIERFRGPTLEEQAAAHGDRLWETDPNACCALRKVEPLGRALEPLDAWITGIRRDQAPTRAATPKAEFDHSSNRWKFSPLADWTVDDVWAYIEVRDLPVNPLHRQGYASIGCTHCTKPGSGREGRWADSEKTECGLHPSGGPIR